MKVNDTTIDMQTLRKIQILEYYMLKEFKKFCELYDLTYTLAYGSIIGAVRHEGFVPWDDDIDIAMLRDDYELFLELGKQWNHPDIFIQNYSTDREFIHSFTRLRLNGTLAIQDTWQNLNVHHGIFVDIFPFDAIAGNQELSQIHANQIKKIQDQKMKIVENQTVTNDNLYRLNKKQTILAKKYNKLSGNNHTVAHMTQGLDTYYDLRRDVNDFYDYELRLFEDDYFPIPKNYDILMKRSYGEYMKYPNIKDRIPHHGVIELKLREDILTRFTHLKQRKNTD